MSDSQIGRRFFLRILGATGVAAGCSPAHAPEKLVPLLVPPQNMVPGKALFYRSVCRECPAGCGVTARSREGRVIKLEGNPNDPVSGGALCARGQAALQRLYAPDRFHGPMLRGADGRLAPVAWDVALAKVADGLKAAAPSNVRLRTRSEPGSAGAIQRAFLAALGAAPEHRIVTEAPDRKALREACALLYGRAEVPAFDLRGPVRRLLWCRLRRDVALAGGARPGIRFRAWTPPAAAHGVGLDRPAPRRHGRDPPSNGSRAAPAESWMWPSCSCAGSSIRRTMSPTCRQQAPAVRAALASLDPEAGARRAGVSREEVAALGNALVSRRPSALLGSGTTEKLAALLLIANHLLGNVGRTVLLGQDSLLDVPAAAPPGQPRALLLHHAEPTAADATVPLIVSFSSRPTPARRSRTSSCPIITGWNRSATSRCARESWPSPRRR